MPGKIINLENLNCEELKQLDKAKTVFFIPISPLEQHGPHLPIGVDIFNAEFSARKAAEYTNHIYPAFNTILYPTIPLGTQVFDYTGSFSVKQTTIYEIIYNIGKSLAKSGFKYIFVFSAHGTAKQIVAIESACRKISRKFQIEMHCLTGGLSVRFLKGEFYQEISAKLGKNFSDEQLNVLKYDYHAGWWETSMMLLNYPSLVKPAFKELKPYLKDIVKRKVITPENKFQGYIGAPAFADAEFAQASVEVMIKVVGDQLDRCFKGDDITEEVTSSLYKYIIFRPHFKKYLRIGILVVIKLIVLIYIINKYI